MRGIEKLPSLLQTKIKCQDGFLKDEDIKQIEAIDPHLLILVRCNNGRFLTPAQNCLHFANIIEQHFTEKENKFGGVVQAVTNGADYVRDFSLPA